MNALPVLVLLFAAAGGAHAAVYKCEVAGKTSYSDKPCHQGDAPAQLPALTGMEAAKPSTLSKQYDQSLAKDKKARDTADRAFVQQQAQEAARVQRARDAIVHHRVIKGMSRAEVASALGSPDNTDALGRSTYRDGNKQVVVSFENERVSRISEASGHRSPHRKKK